MAFPAKFKAHSGTDSEFVFGPFDAHLLITIKETVANHLRKLLQATEKEDLAAKVLGNSGTHSLCKFAVTTAHNSGCPKDDVDVPGCWKSNAHQQDTYCADTTIL